MSGMGIWEYVREQTILMRVLLKDIEHVGLESKQAKQAFDEILRFQTKHSDLAEKLPMTFSPNWLSNQIINARLQKNREEKSQVTIKES